MSYPQADHNLGCAIPSDQAAAVILDLAGTGSKLTQLSSPNASASSDLETIENIFDTNHNGKLDAGDAKSTKFKVLMTNLDGTTTLKTLADAGVASIDLTPNATSTISPGPIRKIITEST